MLRRGRRVSKKAGRKMARRGRARRSRPVGKTVVEFASAKQVIQLTDDPVNTIVALDNVNLGQFDRLSAIARCYQYYRITKVEMKFKPYWDTFISNAGPSATGSVPYLHWLIDTGEVLLPTGGPLGFNQIRDAGAKPIRFDDKTITVRWRPRVPQVTLGDSGALPALSYAMASKLSPWLPTNNAANQDPTGWVPSTVPHKGLYYGVEQASPNFNVFYGVEITVYAQFKKPLTYSFIQGEQTPAPSKVIAPKETSA